MLTTTNVDMGEACRRAAEIRGRWSQQERQRRIGLPPDAPFKLREFILGCRVGSHQTKSRC